MKRYFEFFAVLCAVYCVGDMVAGAASAPTVMSKYGEIQSVNKYSSNPFWTPNSPYNQRIPSPIYVTGADLNTENCNRVVATLVDAYCQENNYCANEKISDARPYLMVQLSQLPGHNFATACGGYVDSAFSQYKQEHPTGVNVSSMMVQTAGANKATNVQFENPWKQTKTEYEQAVADRTTELERLHAQTSGSTAVVATAFPTTISDLSFSERVANDTAGFEPYKDKSAYVIPKFESDQDFYARLKTQNPAEYKKLFQDTADDETALEEEDKDDAASNTKKKCPDPEHMDADCKKCKDIDLHKTKFDKTTNKCVCENGGDIDNDCNETLPSEPDETYFIFWDCRGTPEHHRNLINARNAGDTGVIIRRDNCKIRPGRGSTHNCIGMQNEPNKGIINRLFYSQFNYWLGRRDTAFYNLSPENSYKHDFEIPESDVDTFIDTITSNINDVKKECTSTESWRLFIDKHIVRNGQHIYKPYKTICLGGSFCTAGEVKTH